MLGAGGENNSVHVGLDGAPLTLGGRGVTVRGGAWEWQQRLSVVGTTVLANIDPPGVYTLNLWMREDGTTVDQILLTTQPGYAPRDVEATLTPPEEYPAKANAP